jgi:hypothetical protein
MEPAGKREGPFDVPPTGVGREIHLRRSVRRAPQQTQHRQADGPRQIICLVEAAGAPP